MSPTKLGNNKSNIEVCVKDFNDKTSFYSKIHNNSDQRNKTKSTLYAYKHNNKRNY